MFVATVLLLIAAVLFVFAFGRHVSNFLYKTSHIAVLARNIPSPPAYPIVGHIPYFTGDPLDVYDTLFGISNKFAPTFCLWMGPILAVFVTSLEDIEEVMTNPKLQTKSFLYKSVIDLIGDGLLSLNGEVHRRHRKAMTPSLHLDILNDFVAVFDEQTCELANTLGKLGDEGKVFDVKPMCGHTANASVCRTVFSTTVSDEQCNRADLVAHVGVGQELFTQRLWHPWLLIDWLYSWTSNYSEFNKVIEMGDNFVRTLLRIKTQRISENSNVPQTRKRLAFLDHMLQSKEGAALNKEELFHETKTIAVVASATSMDLLAILCYTLSLRQDMQQRVQEEVDAIFGSDDARPVEPSDLPHLQFTERFIKEVLRYFPVAPIFARNCPQDIKFPSGFTAPKGCQIVLFLPAVHRNPDSFPEPAKFNPDRFLPENSRSRHPFSFIPFSAGSRNCIGQRYAMTFMKTAVANLVRRIHFLPAPDSPTRLEDVKVKMDITLGMRNQANIRVQKRCHSKN